MRKVAGAQGEQRERVAEHMGRGGELEEAGGTALVRRDRHRERGEAWQDPREDEAQRGDAELGPSVEGEGRGGIRAMPAIAQTAEEIAARAEPTHEDRGDERGRVDGVAEDARELAHPDHLVDETAHAREKEEREEEAPAAIEGNIGHEARDLYPRPGELRSKCLGTSPDRGREASAPRSLFPQNSRDLAAASSWH
jgi:hypothetical protein